jgi:hypothetical protein
MYRRSAGLVYVIVDSSLFFRLSYAHIQYMDLRQQTQRSYMNQTIKTTISTFNWVLIVSLNLPGGGLDGVPRVRLADRRLEGKVKKSKQRTGGELTRFGTRVTCHIARNLKRLPLTVVSGLNT